MLIPREHGAWGMLLIPLVTGVVVSSGAGVDLGAVVLFVVAALALFWMRTPVEVWLGTTAIKAQTPEERAVVVRASLGLALLAFSAIAGLFCLRLSHGLLIIGSVAAGAFGLQAVVRGFGRIGRMPSQVIGAIGLTSTAAGAYYVAVGRLDRTAFALWFTSWLFAGDQVHYVQVRIRGSRLATTAEKLRHAYRFIVGQIVLLVVLVVLTRIGLFPRLTTVAFVPALLRGALWFRRGNKPLDVHKLGLSELIQALVFGALLCLVFLV